MSNTEWHFEQARGELAARQDTAADLERRVVCLSLAADRAARVIYSYVLSGDIPAHVYQRVLLDIANARVGRGTP